MRPYQFASGEKSVSKTVPKVDRFLDTRGVRSRVVFSLQHIIRLEQAGAFPLRRYLGPARLAWSQNEVVAWMQAKIDARGISPFSTAPIQPLTGEDRFIGKTELRSLVVYSPQHIRLLESDGLFPKRIWIGQHRVAWLERDILAWMASRGHTRLSPTVSFQSTAP